jgi:hypothetical protein
MPAWTVIERTVDGLWTTSARTPLMGETGASSPRVDSPCGAVEQQATFHVERGRSSWCRRSRGMAASLASPRLPCLAAHPAPRCPCMTTGAACRGSRDRRPDDDPGQRRSSSRRWAWTRTRSRRTVPHTDPEVDGVASPCRSVPEVATGGIGGAPSGAHPARAGTSGPRRDAVGRPRRCCRPRHRRQGSPARAVAASACCGHAPPRATAAAPTGGRGDGARSGAIRGSRDR